MPFPKGRGDRFCHGLLRAASALRPRKAVAVRGHFERMNVKARGFRYPESFPAPAEQNDEAPAARAVVVAVVENLGVSTHRRCRPKKTARIGTKH